MQKIEDYYQILGVSENASADEIKNSFRRLAKIFHPDVNKTPGAEDVFKKINEAYQVLSDPNKRSKYDTIRIYVAYSQPNTKTNNQDKSNSSSEAKNQSKTNSNSYAYTNTKSTNSYAYTNTKNTNSYAYTNTKSTNSYSYHQKSENPNKTNVNSSSKDEFQSKSNFNSYTYNNKKNTNPFSYNQSKDSNSKENSSTHEPVNQRTKSSKSENDHGYKSTSYSFKKGRFDPFVICLFIISVVSILMAILFNSANIEQSNISSNYSNNLSNPESNKNYMSLNPVKSNTSKSLTTTTNFKTTSDVIAHGLNISYSDFRLNFNNYYNNILHFEGGIHAFGNFNYSETPINENSSLFFISNNLYTIHSIILYLNFNMDSNVEVLNIRNSLYSLLEAVIPTHNLSEDDLIEAYHNMIDQKSSYQSGDIVFSINAWERSVTQNKIWIVVKRIDSNQNFGIFKLQPNSTEFTIEELLFAGLSQSNEIDFPGFYKSSGGYYFKDLPTSTLDISSTPIQLTKKEGGYSEKELIAAGHVGKKNYDGTMYYEGFYLAPNGNYYPVGNNIINQLQ